MQLQRWSHRGSGLDMRRPIRYQFGSSVRIHRRPRSDLTMGIASEPEAIHAATIT